MEEQAYQGNGHRLSTSAPCGTSGLIVTKEKIAANGEYNLSGERYREGTISNATFPFVAISEVCETTSGGTPSKSNSDFYEGGTIPWLRSGEVSQGEIFRSELFITEAGLTNSAAKIFPANTVLVAMYGATAGQVGILRFAGSTNQAICGITPRIAFAGLSVPDTKS